MSGFQIRLATGARDSWCKAGAICRVWWKGTAGCRTSRREVLPWIGVIEADAIVQT
jgi:hypothetical protein